MAFSIDRALGVASLILGLAGTGIAILWPTHRGIGWAFLIAAGAVGVIAGVWALARWHTRKELVGQQAPGIVPMRPVARAEARSGDVHVNVGTIHQNAEQRTTAIERPERTFALPFIEFTNPVIKPQVIDARGCLRTATTSPNIDAMLLRFYYSPQQNVPPYLFVKAHISIADAQGNPIKARYDGTWEENCESRTIRLGTAETCVLVVALFPPPEHNDGECILTWGFEFNADGFAPDQTLLKGGEFIVWVQLVGKYQSDVVINAPFRFRLNVGRRSMDLLT